MKWCALVVLGCVALVLQGHTPYKQWKVYRADRLMVVATALEPEAFPLAKAVVNHLRQTIPKARPEATRAPTLRHVGRLILSRQIEVAVVTGQQARMLFRGEDDSSREGPVPLRILAFLSGGYVLVTHEKFNKDNAALLVVGLFGEQGSAKLSRKYKTIAGIRKRAGELSVPVHAGTLEYLQQRKEHVPQS